ncbi:MULTISPECIES: hypothetical protein [unclassified Rhizobium]|uniref:hypothetical protein n=1 Tax=unclassified Rhizobium TaxID=2613769 RepID=UPI000BD583BD|nr:MULTISPECIES: hypothetical protein [unclassified Rhizobium]MDH7809991.1 hypothetical protein [Rhizobium sp. AN67]MDQ4409049.1 hypothetical protein [Rhizobium sp. AN63]SOD51187.1 hypothetical protein SAMN05216595_0589 [Rhizobium sp. AN6A]
MMKSLGIFLIIAALSGASVPTDALATIGPGHVTGVVCNLTHESVLELYEQTSAMPGHVTVA